MVARNVGSYIHRLWQARRNVWHLPSETAELDAGKETMTLKTPHVRTLGRACEGPASREETVAELRQAILARLTYTIGKDPAEAS